MVARFEVPKRQGLLLEALADLTDIPWQLQFIGDGSLRPSLEKYVVEHNLTERVQFLGNRMDVTTLLAKSQLFVLLSDWKGLPISIIEAMRVGLPVIASNVGGVNELIIDGEHGFLIERNEKVLLKKHLQQLLSDETLRKKWVTIVNDIFQDILHFPQCIQKRCISTSKHLKLGYKRISQMKLVKFGRFERNLLKSIPENGGGIHSIN